MPQTHPGSAWDGTPVQSIAGLSGVLTLGDLGFDAVWTPATNGLVTANGDPALTSGNAVAVSGTKYVLRVPVVNPGMVSNIWMGVATAGNTLTSNQNGCAIYNAAGTQLSTTADQTTPWTSTGIKQMALAATVAIASPYVYVEVLSVGTTPPAFTRYAATSNQTANVNLSGATLRAATNGLSATALDASLTPASLANTNSPLMYWVGLS